MFDRKINVEEDMFMEVSEEHPVNAIVNLQLIKILDMKLLV
jgi:hypothetical protein